MPTDQQLDGMHNNFKHVVKRIGGCLKPGDSQFRLQKYLKSSLVQKKRLLDENGCAEEVQEYYRKHTQIHNEIYGQNAPAVVSEFIKSTSQSMPHQFKNFEEPFTKLLKCCFLF